MTQENKAQDKALVVYHANCIDGFTSYWVAEKALREVGYDVVSYAAEYSEEAELEIIDLLEQDLDIEALYVVDYSLTTDTLLTLQNAADLDITILDHHKTAFERYNPSAKEVGKYEVYESLRANTHIKLHNAECGASLCWKHFYPRKELPLLIKYVRDYDLWLFEEGEVTKYVNKYLSASLKSLESWTMVSKVLATEPTSIICVGRDLQQSHDMEVARYVARGKHFRLAGVNAIQVEAPRSLASDIGHALCEQYDAVGATFTVDPDNSSIRNYSLRSVGDRDVSAIAKVFGGGGHKNAAGFTVDTSKVNSDGSTYEGGEDSE